MKFREHKGSLSDAMDTVVEVNSISDIAAIINKSWDYFGKKVEQIQIEYYTYDERINWETFIVTYRLFGEEQFYVAGFTDGNFK
jgi:hypothetical protein